LILILQLQFTHFVRKKNQNKMLQNSHYLQLLLWRSRRRSRWKDNNSVYLKDLTISREAPVVRCCEQGTNDLVFLKRRKNARSAKWLISIHV